VVTFTEAALGRGYTLEIAMMDDAGVLQGPDLRGRLDIITVERHPLHMPLTYLTRF
jgi:hypothetical protein